MARRLTRHDAAVFHHSVWARRNGACFSSARRIEKDVVRRLRRREERSGGAAASTRGTRRRRWGGRRRRSLRRSASTTRGPDALQFALHAVGVPPGGPGEVAAGAAATVAKPLAATSQRARIAAEWSASPSLNFTGRRLETEEGRRRDESTDTLGRPAQLSVAQQGVAPSRDVLQLTATAELWLFNRSALPLHYQHRDDRRVALGGAARRRARRSARPRRPPPSLLRRHVAQDCALLNNSDFPILALRRLETLDARLAAAGVVPSLVDEACVAGVRLVRRELQPQLDSILDGASWKLNMRQTMTMASGVKTTRRCVVETFTKATTGGRLETKITATIPLRLTSCLSAVLIPDLYATWLPAVKESAELARISRFRRPSTCAPTTSGRSRSATSAWWATATSSTPPRSSSTCARATPTSTSTSAPPPRRAPTPTTACAPRCSARSCSK